MVWTRRAFIAAGLSGIAGAAYATVIEPRWRLHHAHYRFDAQNPLSGWKSTKSVRIAVLSDPHVNRPFMPPEAIAHVVELTQAAKPDIIVLPGDFISSMRGFENTVTMEEIADCFAPLRVPLGVHAVLGNHDWWDDPRGALRPGDTPRIAQALNNAGINVMENDALRIDQDGHAFWLLGLGDQWAFRLGRSRFQGVDDLPRTLAQIDDDAPAILLAHEPDIFPEVPKRVSLTLSGHTHAGQVRFLGWAPKIPSKYGHRYLHGHIKEQDRHLIVSAGIGCSVLPIRFGAPPEIVVIDIDAHDAIG